MYVIALVPNENHIFLPFFERIHNVVKESIIFLIKPIPHIIPLLYFLFFAYFHAVDCFLLCTLLVLYGILKDLKILLFLIVK